MRKKSLLALLLVMSLLMSGCALVTVDQAADNARTIIDVNGETVTKLQVSNAVNNAISQNEYMNQLYAMFGMTGSAPTDKASITPQVISAFVENLVSLQKAKELGLDQYTDEDKAKIQEETDKDWQSYLSQVANAYFPDQELEGEALEAEALKYIEENGLATKDQIAESATEEVLLEKLRDYAVKDVAVTEAELEALLNDKITADMEEFAADANAYGDAVNGDETVYYAPAGYRQIKQILVALQSDDSTAITTAEGALTTAQNNLTTAQDALTNAAEDADKDALQAAVDEAQKAVDEAQKAVDEAEAAAFANIQDKVNDIYAKATAEGADFDALQAEYNEDTVKDKTYAVCAGYSSFVEAFTNGAMALQNVGDVSEPIKSTYGYHIIKYVADVQEGAVTLDAVRDTLATEALSSKQEETYNAALAAWTEEANVKTYPEKMN